MFIISPVYYSSCFDKKALLCYSRKFMHTNWYANRTDYLCTGIRKDHVPISEQQQQQRDDQEEETNEWTISFTWT